MKKTCWGHDIYTTHFRVTWVWVFVFFAGLAVACSHGQKRISGWHLLHLFHLTGNQFMFLRGFCKDVNWRTSKWERLEICFKSMFLIQAKAQMQMCPYCPLRISVNLYGSLFLASHHVGYYFIWEKMKLGPSSCFLWLRRLTPFTES